MYEQPAKNHYIRRSLSCLNCTCWLPNQEIYITGTAPYSTGTVIYLCHFWKCNFFTGNVILALGYHTLKFSLLVLYLKPEYITGIVIFLITVPVMVIS
jgi:hypothetical protein